MFADDLSAAILGFEIRVIRDVVQECLCEFNEWFRTRGLKISITNSMCMIVGKKPRERNPIPLKLGDIEIPYVR